MKQREYIVISEYDNLNPAICGGKMALKVVGGGFASALVALTSPISCDILHKTKGNGK